MTNTAAMADDGYDGGGQRPSNGTLPAGRDAATCLQACLAVEANARVFKTQIRFPQNKSRELIAGLLLREWLREETRLLPAFGPRGDILVSTGQTGIDATLLDGAGRSLGPLEIKTRNQEKPGGHFDFIFKPDFPFAKHCMLAMLELVQGQPYRMFVAHGSQVMELLEHELHLDKLRVSYKPEERAGLPLWSRSKAGTATRLAPTNGLEALAGGEPPHGLPLPLLRGMQPAAGQRWSEWIATQGDLIRNNWQQLDRALPADQWLKVVGPDRLRQLMAKLAPV